METEKLQEFLNEYDTSRNLVFNNIKFRPGAKLRYSFGLNTKYNGNSCLFINLSTTTINNSIAGDKLFSPFFITHWEYAEKNLILYTDYDFHLRISPVNDSHFLISKPEVKVGEKITHFDRPHFIDLQIKSDTENSILENILYKKYGKRQVNQKYSKTHIKTILKSCGVDETLGYEVYEDLLEALQVSFLNCFKAKKENMVIYNSRALFNV